MTGWERKLRRVPPHVCTCGSPGCVTPEEVRKKYPIHSQSLEAHLAWLKSVYFDLSV